MMDGFLNILKPPGMSSHDVIGAVRKVMIEGLPLARVWPELAVLTGMTVATLIVALKKYNKRID